MGLHGEAIELPTEEERALIHADLFHGVVRDLETQKGESLSPEELTQLDGLMDKMAEMGRAAGHIAAESEREDS